MTDLLLAIDTATRTGVLGLADLDGRLLAAETWSTGHRHGEELLSRLGVLLGRVGAQASDISGIAVGVGPGSFTGLRIGLATAKTLAYGLGVPVVGISTAQALALAVAGPEGSGRFTITLPAGAHDRYLATVEVAAGRVRELEPPRLITSPDASVAGTLVAVDLEPSDVPVEAVIAGHRAVEGLAAALASLGAKALAAGNSDDVAELVPAYIALPRGLAEVATNVEWSPDLR